MQSSGMESCAVPAKSEGKDFVRVIFEVNHDIFGVGGEGSGSSLWHLYFLHKSTELKKDEVPKKSSGAESVGGELRRALRISRAMEKKGN